MKNIHIGIGQKLIACIILLLITLFFTPADLFSDKCVHNICYAVKAESAVPSTEQPDTKKAVAFTKKTTKLKAGKSYTFQAQTVNFDGNIVFSVSNSKIASITENGKLTGKKAGTVTVTATASEYSTSIKVTITPKKIVALDPGHSGVVAGGTEPVGPGAKIRKAKDASGTRGIVTKIPEYKLTLSLAKKMKKLLEDRGYKVVMTRTSNKKAISCVKRAKIANNAKADIFIRIHADGIDNTSVSGATALYPSKSNPYVGKLSKKSKKLSKCILNAMCKKSGAKNRGLSARDDLSGSNWAKMPVTLIEVGFMTNLTEDRKLKTTKYQNKLAQGMVDGIDDYFGY